MTVGSTVRISPSDLREAILGACAKRGLEKSVCPSEVARSLGGKDETIWRHLMKPIRREAVRLAKEGRIVIQRKGQIVDPEAFKGIYRLALPPEGDAPVPSIDNDQAAADSSGAGIRESIRPTNQ